MLSSFDQDSKNVFMPIIPKILLSRRRNFSRILEYTVLRQLDPDTCCFLGGGISIILFGACTALDHGIITQDIK
jgi:hypothetical protein